MKSTRYAIFLVVLSTFCAAGTQAIPLISNGSFESPTVTPGSFQDFLSGSSALIGWTVVGNAGTEVSIVSTTFTQSGFSFVAEDGSQWLDLTGDGTNNMTEGVAQTVATNVGHLYSLSFWIGNVVNPGGPFGTTSTVGVSENGTSLGNFTNSGGVGTLTLNWEMFSTTFVATSASTTLQFLNGDSSSDNSNGLDNISLSDQGSIGTSTPEPASLILLASGVLSALGLRRRK